MDTGRGNFARISPNIADLLKGKSAGGKVFAIGDVVRVKDSQFTIEAIGKHTMKLRLISDDDYQQIQQPKKKL